MSHRRLRKLKKLSMYKALQLGYMRGNEEKQARKLKRYGYVLDKDLTNNERLVAYSPYTKKVVFVENGSSTDVINDLKQVKEDWGHNLNEVIKGTFTTTPRFQDAQSAYLKAKKKYGEETPFKMVGHSQAAITINELAGKNDKGITYNGALIKQKDNPNVTNIRSPGDVVSAFANPHDMKTLHQPVQNLISAHNISNIQKLPVFL